MSTPQPNRKSPPRNTIRYSDAQLDEFLNSRASLQPKAKGESASARRVFVRMPFRASAIEVKFVHPGGTESRVILAGRDLSAGGMSLLHRTFVHEGTKCILRLPDTAGQIQEVSGTVVRCILLQGTVHEIGVAFDTTLAARNFVPMDPFAGGFSFEQVLPEELKGTLLYIGDQEMDQTLMRHFLRATQMRLLFALDRGKVMEQLSEGIDLIICDYHLASDDGAGVTEYVRSEGISTPILIVTADRSKATRDRLIKAQANGLLGKPLVAATLYRAIAEFIVVNASGNAATSSLPADHPNRGLIPNFVAQSHELAGRLEKAIAEESVDTARSLCLQVAGTAPLLGFDKLALMASEAERALTASMSVAESVSPLRRLTEACRRVSDRVA